MKTIGIMQPYFMPYIGYWQLINMVDTFVILDDVNYIRRGFINRNSILVNGKSYRFSIPVEKASQNKLIKDTKLIVDIEVRKSFLKTIELSYKKAKMFSEFFPILESIVLYDSHDLTTYILFSIKAICKYLKIDTEILLSSRINKDVRLRGEERIIEINRVLNSDRYVNPIGGMALYSFEEFSKNKIELLFIKPKEIVYDQFQNRFIPNLSLIDVLMFNNLDSVIGMLEQYELIDNEC